jgi:putative phosphonoacetaldehyde dehydrogenase
MADIRRESMRIAGEHVASERVIEVLNPWNGATVGTVPRGTVADIRRAFAAARAFRSPLSRHERSLILSRAAERLAARREEISDLITAESGLCKKDTLYEVGRAIDVFTFAAHAALIDDSQTFSCDVSAQGRRRRIHTQREPLRAISAITPFNHPLNQVAHKVAPSIATNNKMVLKPSEKTPLTALLLADVLYDVGLPPAMLSVVTGDPPEIADELITNPDCELITFTGGVAVGKSIASKMGYRRAVLELGGNDPLIVMEDADLQEASSLAVSGAYKNSGQRCTAVKRILVQESVAARFVDLLVEKTRLVKHGDPMDHTTDMGTVIDEAVAIRFQSLVDDAVSRGARLLHGNERRGALYSPTVLDRVPPDCELVARETFGPVAPVIRFREIEEAIRIANSTPYGLSSAVCTNRLDWITRFVNGLEVGTVNVREVPGYRLENSPFGGIKDSGLGYKEGVLEAMKSFTNVKTYSLPWA